MQSFFKDWLTNTMVKAIHVGILQVKLFGCYETILYKWHTSLLGYETPPSKSFLFYGDTNTLTLITSYYEMTNCLEV